MSGKFISDNFKQARRVIQEGKLALAQWRAALPQSFSDEEIEQWRHEELDYLQSVGVEDEYDLRLVAYVEALEHLEAAQRAVDRMRATIDVVHYPLDSGRLSKEADTVARAKEAERNALQHRLMACMGAVDDTERLAGVTKRWRSEDEQYKAALRYVQMRGFERVLTKLEGLVVQRLTELAKANLVGTGYKLRKHISHNLSKRSETIRNTLAKYNELAPKQDPPRPRIEYSDVVSYAFLGEFELLKYSKHAILERPWSTPTNRQMADKHHKVKRAEEEVLRSTVEARRLRRWVDEEDSAYRLAISQSRATDPLIAAELTWTHARQLRVNNVHRMRLRKLYSLPDFGHTYALDGAEPSLVTEPLTQIAGGDTLEGMTYSLDGIDEDDSLNDEALRLGEFMENIKH
ncbi:hypothetical protein HDZ31DRAFT_34848 [Schizophyllum fasciatum]